VARYDFRAYRLFVESPLASGARIEATTDQAHYLRHVLRLPDGAPVVVFNGRDGEWSARLSAAGKRGAALMVEARLRAQEPAGDLHYLFAPLKSARLDYMVQKAVEMGVSRLSPVLTRRTQAQRLNGERLAANAVEAAEQCGILALPVIDEPRPLADALAALEPQRLLIFCDEEAEVSSPLEALAGQAAGPLALLIGPEGGFTEEERALALRHARVTRLSLGPRILRADTAAIAALALVQAALGDWR
jgi:16S rRNA (uracil1498-N3)-methyltransferase